MSIGIMAMRAAKTYSEKMEQLREKKTEWQDNCLSVFLFSIFLAFLLLPQDIFPNSSHSADNAAARFDMACRI